MKDRHLIHGTLTTRSPLHIGSGDRVYRAGVARAPEPGATSTAKPVEIAGIAIDHASRPYLPGSTLKGNLRAWLESQIDAAHPAASLVNGVFGSRDANGSSGKVEFRDAHARPGVTLAHPPPHWVPDLLSGVGVSVAIDRSTRTASDKKLFHYELVPPGIAFDVTLAARGLDDDELLLLLLALRAFDDPFDPVTLGAGTGDGWGRLRWQDERVSFAGPKEAAAWLLTGQMPTDAACRPLALPAPLTPPAAWQPATRAIIEIPVALQFDDGFLLNDPSRCADGGEADDVPDRAPLRDEAGQPILPASSVRGALRSQAERILRTLAPDAACDPASLPGACGCCPACQVFGSTRRRSAIQVSDFTAQGVETRLRRQEFIAIDRFTGGGARDFSTGEPHGLKFNAEVAERPCLEGAIRVHLGALAGAGCGPWAFALLGLLFRDLVEGDIFFGSGASRGFAACHIPDWKVIAQQISVPPHAAWPKGLRERVGEAAVTGLAAAEWLEGSPLAEEFGYWLIELEERVGQPAEQEG